MSYFISITGHSLHVEKFGIFIILVVHLECNLKRDFIIRSIVNNYNHFDLIDSLNSSFWIVPMKINSHIIVESSIDENNQIYKCNTIM